MSSKRSRPDENLGTSPSRISSPELRFEAQRAFVWAAVIGSVVLALYISQALLIIFGALVVASMIDGGARLLARILPIPRVWRVSLVLLFMAGFFYWLITYAGSQISREAAQFPAIIQQQAGVALDWLRGQGFAVDAPDFQALLTNLMSGVGTVTRAISGLLGWLTTLLLVTIIGVYLAYEPRMYERGVAWMLPAHRRSQFFKTASQMGRTMRRLMAGRLVGMVFEGVFTYVMLAIVGPLVGIGAVPMAALLAILTGLLAFIPNLGAILSGVLMVLVGFSGGTDMGLYTIFVYFLVQNFDGYIVIPMIARKTVDLAPALVLSSQLIMGVLFGILGLFLADPLLAMIKVALERRAEQNQTADENAKEAADGT
ncbi:AI-2E family transporter [Pontixanthobacter sp. CEM42]|uniref:AI-2E family transporter n=1 Tax=Pontixanthobacter sp. CEM42 TaxID=2792077 RepID=UPI001ADECDAB